MTIYPDEDMEEEEADFDPGAAVAQMRDAAMPLSMSSAVGQARDRITKLLNRRASVEPEDVAMASLASLGGYRKFSDELEKRKTSRRADRAETLRGETLLYNLARQESADKRAAATEKRLTDTATDTAAYRRARLQMEWLKANNQNLHSAVELVTNALPDEAKLDFLRRFSATVDVDKIGSRSDALEAAFGILKEMPEVGGEGGDGFKAKGMEPEAYNTLAKLKARVDAGEKLTPSQMDKYRLAWFKVAERVAVPGGGVSVFNPDFPSPDELFGGTAARTASPSPGVSAPQTQAGVRVTPVVQPQERTPAQMGELRERLFAIQRGSDLVNRIRERVAENPAAFGAWGDIRQLFSRAKGAAQDIPGLDIGANILDRIGTELGMKERDPDLQGRDVLELRLIGFLTRALEGRGGRDLRAAREEAKSIANLGGLSGSKDVMDRLNQIAAEFAAAERETSDALKEDAAPAAPSAAPTFTIDQLRKIREGRGRN